MIARIVAFLLRKNLSLADREILINAVMHTLGAPPMRAIITTDDNRRIVVQGKPLSIEQTMSLREGAYALSNNQALRLIRDHVRFNAIDNGFLKNVNADPYAEMFYKAALWYAQEESNLIDSLAATQDSTLN